MTSVDLIGGRIVHEAQVFVQPKLVTNIFPERISALLNCSVPVAEGHEVQIE